MPRWRMIVDLRKCIGCGICTEVCEQFNRLPPGAKWRKLIEYENKGNPRLPRIYITMSCMHCNRAPCLDVCPTQATYRRDDGIVDINLELCLGCGACITACPYQARSIATQDVMRFKTEETEDADNALYSDRIGVCTKCHFCRERIDRGIARGLKPGIDPDATPICVRYCIADAIYFGDVDDPESEIAHFIRDNKVIGLLEELNTEVSVLYILED